MMSLIRSNSDNETHTPHYRTVTSCHSQCINQQMVIPQMIMENENATHTQNGQNVLCREPNLLPSHHPAPPRHGVVYPQ